jgi:hypothetical protein
MADDYQNFKVNVHNFMGFENSEARNELYAISLSNPKLFFEIRNAVVKKVRDQTIERFFEVFYNALTSGTDLDGNLLHPSLPVPHWPSQEVSKLCLGCAKTIEQITNDVIDKIIPLKFEQLADKRTHDKAAAMGL